MCRRTLGGLLTGLTLAVFVVSCDRTQTVSLTAEDFRFVPDLVRVPSSVPLALTVFNAGREIHEFDSPVLTYAAGPGPAQSGKAETPGLRLAPGQSVRLVMAPPPGTYLYICRRKGHANMSGTLIVD